MLYPPRCPFCGEIRVGETEQNHKTNRSFTGKNITDRGENICVSCRNQLPCITEPRCMKCGKPLSDETQEYCADCAKHTLDFDQGRSLWTHTGSVPHAIYQFKFHNKRYYAGIFAGEMAKRYGDWIEQCQIETIIPVPLHSSKRRSRGYNQAELLAKELGKLTGIAVESRAVVRVRKTMPQKELSHRERRDNLKGAFGVRRTWEPGKAVLLIDDIYTTGNTIHRIAKVLKKAGVQKVYFLTISIGQGL